jgi:hypothetical protein
LELIDFELIKRGAYTAAEMNSQLFASAMTMPVLMFQVLEDAWTNNPEDAQKTFDLISSAEKELFWIENTLNIPQNYRPRMAGSRARSSRIPADLPIDVTDASPAGSYSGNARQLNC